MATSTPSTETSRDTDAADEPRIIAPTVVETSLDESAAAEEELEGQLTIDMYQTPDAVIIKSTIAGVAPEDLSVTLDGDVLTVRGKRHAEEKIQEKDYFYQECYWGSFSRTVTLPVEIDPDKVRADIKNGILTVTLTKARSARPKKIRVTG